MNFEQMKNTSKNFFLKQVGGYCFGVFLLFSVVTQYFQCQTQSIYYHRLILKNMGVLTPWRPYLGWEIQRKYKHMVREVWIDSDTGQLYRKKHLHTYPLYIVGTSSKTVSHYAFPFVFDGAYGPISGIVALKGDGSTVTGFTIMRQNEMGLGSKCGWKWFGKQFREKQIADRNRRYVGLTIVNGNIEEKVPASDVVQTIEGISGAIQTNKKIETLPLI